MHASFRIPVEMPSMAIITVITIGGAVSIAITGVFSQMEDLLLIAYAGWMGLCVFVAELRDGNRAYAARAVGFVREQGINLPDGLLSHVAPVKWDHIALTGDYLWSEIEPPRERFRPLRTNRLDPARFQSP